MKGIPVNTKRNGRYLRNASKCHTQNFKYDTQGGNRVLFLLQRWADFFLLSKYFRFAEHMVSVYSALSLYNM